MRWQHKWLPGVLKRKVFDVEFTPDQINAFRYWIQGYPNFYEPIVEEYFRVAGYRVLRRPALVGRADIQRVIDAST